MSDDLPSLSDMMDAFMHPPTVAIVVGHRHETHDGLIQIVSTVELWP